MGAYDCDCINNLEYDRCERQAQLSQEGTTFDTISRQQAIDEIKNYCENGCDIAEDNWCPNCQREQFIELLKVLPPAQPEPHEGRFERKQDGVFCSVCHYGWEFITGVPAEVEREYHYCPNCGADMRGEKDG